MLRCALVVVAVSACVVDEPELGSTEQSAASPPWKQPTKWPYQVASPRMIVHYQATGDLSTAQTVLTQVEHAWTVQITQQGARAPLPDTGIAGPDGRYDVYLQRGLDSLYVSSTAAYAATPYDDVTTAMVLDPWGQYGGAEMEANVFHEFRHSSQGTDDWNEHIQVFEAEATMWEALYYGYARLPGVWADYQAHPDWTPFKDDNYSTWFMYGGALFLIHLEKTVFSGSLAFANEMWLRSRSAGTNEPDFIDALGVQLAAKGTTLFDQIVKFNRNRWYTGARANGSLDGGAQLPDVATRSHVRASGALHTTYVANPQVLGTVYIVVTAAPTDGPTLRVSLTSIDTKAKPVVQLVGQSAADRVLDLSSGSATVPVVGGKVVLAVTMLPSNGQFDPDSAPTQLYKATVNLDKI